MEQWLGERCDIDTISHNRKRIMFLEKCGENALTDSVLLALEVINTDIVLFPNTETNLLPPDDSLVIKKLKTV